MRRALQTARLVFHPLQAEGLKLVAWRHVRTMGSGKSSTGLPVAKLTKFVNGTDADLSGIRDGWEDPSYSGSEDRTKTTAKVISKLWRMGREELEKRANPSMIEKRASTKRYGHRHCQGQNIEFVVVTHGSFLDKLQRHVKGTGKSFQIQL